MPSSNDPHNFVGAGWGEMEGKYPVPKASKTHLTVCRLTCTVEDDEGGLGGSMTTAFPCYAGQVFPSNSSHIGWGRSYTPHVPIMLQDAKCQTGRLAASRTENFRKSQDITPRGTQVRSGVICWLHIIPKHRPFDGKSSYSWSLVVLNENAPDSVVSTVLIVHKESPLLDQGNSNMSQLHVQRQHKFTVHRQKYLR